MTPERNKNGMLAKVITVTPELAEKWVQSLEGNRPVRQRHLNRIASDIREGNWRLNGEPLILSNKGELLDGQHRCLGIMQAGKSVKVLVVRGVEKSSMETIDSGLARGLNDVLHFKGLTNANPLSAALTIVWMFTSAPSVDFSERPTRSQLLAIMKDHPRLEEAVSSCRAIIKKIMTASVAGALYYMFGKKDRELADAFLETMLRGKLLPQPFFALRERLLGLPAMHTNARRRAILFYSIKAWNVAREGKKVGHLHIQKGEEMPKIH